LLIVYGAVAGVSVVKLYAGAFFPGLMLAGLYVLYVILMAKIFPKSAPPLSEEERRVPLPSYSETIKQNFSNKALPGFLNAMKGKQNAHVPFNTLLKQLVIVLLPAIVFIASLGLTYKVVTTPEQEVEYGLQEMGSGFGSFDTEELYSGSLAEPEGAGSLSLAEPESAAPLGAESAAADNGAAAEVAVEEEASVVASQPEPTWFWILLAISTVFLVIFYAMFTLARLVVFKML